MMTPASSTPKAYSPDAIAALKGFSGMINIAKIQPIWTTFQTTRNTDIQCWHLHSEMEQWARVHKVEIDWGVFFEQISMDDIISLQFNLGQGVAQFKSTKRKLSMLICHSRTPEESEQVRDRESRSNIVSTLFELKRITFN